MFEIKDLDIILKKVGNNLYDFSAYLNRYKNFYLNSFPILVDYWKGKDISVDPNILVEFDYLYHEYYNMIFAFQKKAKGKDIDLDYFEFVEYLNEIKNHIDYIKNLPRYLKTSINFVDIFEQPVIDYLVKEGDTLESISKMFYGDSENFGKIMDYNNLEYYDVNAIDWVGRKIKIPAHRIIKKDIPGIIDGLIGLNVLGKDINSNFSFSTIADENGNYDIENLEYEDCFEKAVKDILENIPKGSVPEFPYLGNNIKEIIGQNLGALSYSMIINSLIIAMKTEPTLSSVSVTDLKIIDDSMRIDFTFKSVLEKDYQLQYQVSTLEV